MTVKGVKGVKGAEETDGPDKWLRVLDDPIADPPPVKAVVATLVRVVSILYSCLPVQSVAVVAWEAAQGEAVLIGPTLTVAHRLCDFSVSVAVSVCRCPRCRCLFVLHRPAGVFIIPPTVLLVQERR